MKNFLKVVLLFVWGLGLLLVGIDIMSYSQLMGEDTINVINREANVVFGMIMIYAPSIIGFFLVLDSMNKKK